MTRFFLPDEVNEDCTVYAKHCHLLDRDHGPAKWVTEIELPHGTVRSALCDVCGGLYRPGRVGDSDGELACAELERRLELYDVADSTGQPWDLDK